MADFDPPFGSNSDWRLATPTEKDLGFPCGGLDQRLMNGLFRLLLGNVHDIAQEAGVSSNDTGDQTVLKRAVLALIEAAIGEMDEGELDLSNLILMSQAQNRLPIFPEIENSTNTIVPAVPDTGSIQIPSGINFLHRGIRRYSTSDWDSASRTFETDPSKLYHLHWTKDDDFVLMDLEDNDYNPEDKDEADTDFDSTYDDMLIARIVTNSSNVATITGLANAAALIKDDVHDDSSPTRSGENDTLTNYNFTLNFARTPQVVVVPRRMSNSGSFSTFNVNDNDYALSGGLVGALGSGAGPTTWNRYSVRGTLLKDYMQRLALTMHARA